MKLGSLLKQLHDSKNVQMVLGCMRPETSQTEQQLAWKVTYGKSLAHNQRMKLAILLIKLPANVRTAEHDSHETREVEDQNCPKPQGSSQCLQ